ncbi:hypothetical protein GGI1_15148, partial [Acidithiobacillus sp. GGI-221]
GHNLDDASVIEQGGDLQPQNAPHLLDPAGMGLLFLLIVRVDVH